MIPFFHPDLKRWRPKIPGQNLVWSEIKSRMDLLEDALRVTCRYHRERVLIDNLLVRIHFIIVMIRWTGLAPWEFEFPFPGSLTSTFLVPVVTLSVATHPCPYPPMGC